MKKTYVYLVNLLDFAADDEYSTAEEKAAWVKNVRDNVGVNGYTFACGDDDFVTDEFDSSELKAANKQVQVFNFMGSEGQQERFYERDIKIYENKATGDLYVKYEEDLLAF